MLKKLITILPDRVIDRIGVFALVVICVIATIAFFVGGYYLKRSFNYYFGYENDVKNTSTQVICDMIKPDKYDEVLVNPNLCSK